VNIEVNAGMKPTFIKLSVNLPDSVVTFSEEIQKRTLAANRCFHGLRKHLRSQLTSKNTKILMYKVLIKPVLTYASETWTLSKTNERQLSLLKERCFDVFLEQNKRTGHGKKDTTMNYTKYLMSQTLLTIPKLKD